MYSEVDPSTVEVSARNRRLIDMLDKTLILIIQGILLV